MTKSTRGMIFTNENCIGCNRCISGCPIPGANISTIVNGSNRIEVDAEKCIHCGHCMDTCKHNAREYLDDTDAFFKALAKGEEVSLLIAPSFYLDYPKEAGRILAALKKLGAGKIYNVSFGADIATWCYVNYLKEHADAQLISQPCPAVVNYLERYSLDFVTRLAPIQSPMMCTAIYAEKYKKDTAKKAFIGPCIAKKDEILDVGAYVDYNVTLRHLLGRLQLPEGEFAEPVIDTPDYDLGTIYPMHGGLWENVESYIGRGQNLFSLSEGVRYYAAIGKLEQQSEKGKAPVLVDILNCEHGCALGPGVEKSTCNVGDILQQYANCKKQVWSTDEVSCRERLERLNNKFAELDRRDFVRTYKERYIQPMEIPEDTLEDIFNSMYKDTPEKRMINCGSCGYQSCREMAEAIALNYNHMENCVHFEKDENLRLYLTDTMTGIPNVNAYDQFVEGVLRRHENCSYTAVNFSIQDWELINDRYGYAAGDEAIIEFAHQVNGLVSKDEIVARLGSINFLAMIKNENMDSYIERSNNVTLHIDNNGKTELYSAIVRAGMYRLTGEETEIGDVTSRTNIAAIIAKQDEAQNVVFYDDSMREGILDSMMIMKSFPAAIEKQEFIVYYQPKVCMTTLQLIGAEALVRWRTPQGIISPGRFIPVFEKNGTVKQLDLYVLDHVCAQLRSWLDAGIKPVRISSNFSKQHFSGNDVAEQINEVVDRWGVPHKYIEIEFTETAYIDEHDRLKKTLEGLKKAGFSSSIDDFGSGYSSLNLLQNLDFEVLKLDRAFLNLGASDHKTQKIIESIIHMAKKLNMEVVAEGVEKREELEMLRKFSCDTIQGFYFDRPLPAEEFESRLRNKRYSIIQKDQQ